MFTGLVTDVGEIVAADGDPRALRRLRIRTAYPPQSIALGASIACSGICLTSIGCGADWFDVQTAAETLARTTASAWGVGTRLNLERSLKVGDELGGHIVTGHVDGIAEVAERQAVTQDADGLTVRLKFRAPRELARFIAPKGSICLDGTSLTVNEVADDVFSVLLIPHTLAVTTWGSVREGDRVNLEVDLMARYAARLAEARERGY